jgi:hypothetical protein
VESELARAEGIEGSGRGRGEGGRGPEGQGGRTDSERRCRLRKMTSF